METFADPSDCRLLGELVSVTATLTVWPPKNASLSPSGGGLAETTATPYVFLPARPKPGAANTATTVTSDTASSTKRAPRRDRSFIRDSPLDVRPRGQPPRIPSRTMTHGVKSRAKSGRSL